MPEEIYAKKFMNLGALGYINGKASVNEINQAIRNVMDSKRYLSLSLIQLFIESALGKNPENHNPFLLLSIRELEITRHLIKGESLSQIGAILKLHTSTIGTFKKKILQKLGCSNTLEMSKLAMKCNFFYPA